MPPRVIIHGWQSRRLDRPDRARQAVGTVGRALLGLRGAFPRGASWKICGEPSINGYHEYAQVLLNLLMNARDALQGRKVAEPWINIYCCSEEGKSVVTITDNAGGIEREILDKIFDAFFTTKALGKGTGIGLFLSKTITEKKMGGRLTVQNAESGAEFRIEI